MSCLAKKSSPIPWVRGVGAGEGERRLRRFLHHVAELAGEQELPLAGHRHHLDEQQVAADRGPGEAGRDADAVAVQQLFREVLARRRGTPRPAPASITIRSALAARHLDRHLAADRRHLALEIAQPRLLGVAGDDLAGSPSSVNSICSSVRPFSLVCLGIRWRRAMRSFSSSRVAGEADDLHAVEERRLDRLEHVGGGDEHHLRQVVRDAEVVIDEAEVLLRIEHLEQRRRRIAAEVGADLVDLVEHEDRIARPRLADPLDDAAGQRADVGAAMAADLGLVAHAAERDAHELAAERAGDRAAERGLADARRADEAEDRAAGVRLQLAHGEVFEDALLDLLEVVVVLVEHLPARAGGRGRPRRRRPRAARSASRDRCG